jgi:carboxyl-terminal processing protease
MRKELRVIALCLIGVYQCSLADDRVDARDANTDVAKAESEIIPLDDIRILVEVFHKIKKDYVEPITDKALLKEAIRGMLAGLDPHSSYLDADSYLSLQEGTTGEFGGLGIEVGMEDGFLKVIAPIDDTPAERAGVQAGDVIIRLNDTPIKGIGLAESVKLMRGKTGTEIRISVLREGQDKPLEFKILRAVIQIQSVKSKFLEPGFGYVRISHFQSRTGNDVVKQVQDLINKDGKLNGLVLDLRNNPGGVLGAAVAVSDVFLTSGRIVYTQGRAEDSELEFDAKPPDLIDGAPLIVLVNEGSASGALQDRQRAIIMGRRSFGKGSVQTIMPMSNNAALKLTTARYFTPSGRSIQAEGIIPDIEIEKVQLSRTDSRQSDFVKESNLSGHLENSDKGDSADETAASESRLLAESDFELYEALNLLKGMHLIRSRAASN